MQSGEQARHSLADVFTGHRTVSRSNQSVVTYTTCQSNNGAAKAVTVPFKIDLFHDVKQQKLWQQARLEAPYNGEPLSH